MAILTSTNINFLKYRPYCYIFSALIILSFVGGIFYKQSVHQSAFVYSVDFTGGTQVHFKFAIPVTSEQVIVALEKNGLKPTVREFSPSELLVRVSGEKGFENDAKGFAERLKVMLQTEIPGCNPEIKQTDSVGADVGSELRRNSLFAVLLGLLIMLCYIWFRFRSFAFAAGSVVALLHDTVVVLSLVMWGGYEVSMNVIAAVMFILSYSNNDTIVIFSRIRERLFKKTGESLETVVNTSINETLRRTLFTSFATTLVVGSLLIFGGEVLRTLSLALFVGIIFGTYSSIYIASPVMLLLYREKK